MHKKLLVLTLALGCSFNLYAAGLEKELGQELGQEIDKLMSEAITADSPGCNIGVIDQGKFIHKAGYGLANMELDVPLNGDQIHRMASVSKQFTAMAVLLLAEEGKIDLDKDIHEYLPDLRDYKAKVTVRAMLGHFSGMGDYDLIAASSEGEQRPNSANLKSVAGGNFRLGNEDYLTISEFYDVVKTVPLALTPEQEFKYSNLAYFLLSMLVEKVSGQSLRAYTNEKMFVPLGMKNTFFSDDTVEIIKNRAYGYKQREDGTYITDMTNLFWVGDGGLHTNLNDLLLWNNNFYQPQVGKKPTELIKLMNTANSEFEASPKVTYANGQFFSEKNNQISFSHSGGWLGTFTYFARYPNRNAGLIWLCNDVSNSALFETLDTVRDKVENVLNK